MKRFGRKYWSWPYFLGFLWLLGCISFYGWPLSDLKEGESLRWIGFYIAGVGVAPLGLILASMRTGNLKEQLINGEFEHSLKMIEKKESVVRSAGIEVLKELAINNNDRAPIILRILASYIRSRSADVLSRVAGADKGNEGEEAGQEIWYVPTEQGRGKIDELSLNGTSSMLPDYESSLVAMKKIIDRQKGVFSNMVLECVGDGDYTLDLSNSIFINSALSKTDLTKTNLSQIHAVGFVFEGTTFKSANLVGAYFRKCDVKGCSFEEAEFSDTKIAEIDFQSVNFRMSTIGRDCEFKDCCFNNADFSGAKINIAAFEKCNASCFEGAKFDNAVITALSIEAAKRKLRLATTSSTRYEMDSEGSAGSPISA